MPVIDSHLDMPVINLHLFISMGDRFTFVHTYQRLIYTCTYLYNPGYQSKWFSLHLVLLSRTELVPKTYTKLFIQIHHTCNESDWGPCNIHWSLRCLNIAILPLWESSHWKTVVVFHYSSWYKTAQNCSLGNILKNSSCIIFLYQL